MQQIPKRFFLLVSYCTLAASAAGRDRISSPCARHRRASALQDTFRQRCRPLSTRRQAPAQEWPSCSSSPWATSSSIYTTRASPQKSASRSHDYALESTTTAVSCIRCKVAAWPRRAIPRAPAKGDVVLLITKETLKDSYDTHQQMIDRNMIELVSCLSSRWARKATNTSTARNFSSRCETRIWTI